MPKVTMHRVPKLLTLSTLPMSRAVKTRRVSACEPLCAQFGAGVACVPDEGCFAHARRTLRRYKNGKYAVVTRGRPVYQRHEAHAEGNDTTPPHRSAEKALCAGGNSVSVGAEHPL